MSQSTASHTAETIIQEQLRAGDLPRSPPGRGAPGAGEARQRPLDRRPVPAALSPVVRGKPVKVAAATAERPQQAWKKAEEAKAAEDALARKPANAVERAALHKPAPKPADLEVRAPKERLDMADFPDNDFEPPVMVPADVDRFE